MNFKKHILYANSELKVKSIHVKKTVTLTASNKLYIILYDNLYLVGVLTLLIHKKKSRLFLRRCRQRHVKCLLYASVQI